MKRRIALLIGYNGDKFHGIQWNNNLYTIEKVIIDILLSLNLINPLNDIPSKIGMRTCSRTDKGVHAVLNVVTVKINTNITDEITESLKKELIKYDIHLYKICNTTKSFQGHKMARSRIYKYYIPTYLLRTEDYSELSENRIADDLKNRSNNVIFGSEDKVKDKMKREYNEGMVDDMKNYRSEKIEYFNEILQFYVGTNNYRNFTVAKTCQPNEVAEESMEDDREKKKKSGRKGVSESTLNRFIKSIGVTERFVVDDVEYIEITIHGQSFVIHQIRKMMSYAILNCKFASGMEEVKKNYELAFKEKQHIPKSPSQYLFLYNIFFDDYNQKVDEKLEIDDTEAEKIKLSLIYPSIFTKANLVEWLKYMDSVIFHSEYFSIFKNK